MNDYRSVQEALQHGADPAFMCDTCPWDRYCVSPPTMTAGDVEKQMADARAKDEAEAAAAHARGEQPKMPVGSLLSALTFAGRDLQAQVCPVFALRLRSSDGRKIADSVKAQMQGWEES